MIQYKRRMVIPPRQSKATSAAVAASFSLDTPAERQTGHHDDHGWRLLSLPSVARAACLSRILAAGCCSQRRDFGNSPDKEQAARHNGPSGAPFADLARL